MLVTVSMHAAIFPFCSWRVSVKSKVRAEASNAPKPPAPPPAAPANSKAAAGKPNAAATAAAGKSAAAAAASRPATATPGAAAATAVPESSYYSLMLKYLTLDCIEHEIGPLTGAVTSVGTE